MTAAVRQAGEAAETAASKPHASAGRGADMEAAYRSYGGTFVSDVNKPKGSQFAALNTWGHGSASGQS